MTISLNGRSREIDAGLTLAALIVAETGSARGTAIVVDGTVVPRSEWDATVLADGAEVQLITAVQGG